MKIVVTTLKLLVLSVFLFGFLFAQDVHAQEVSPEDQVRAGLWEAMKSCWGTVHDLPEPSRLTVVVYLELDRDGGLIGEPKVLSPTEIEPFDDVMLNAVQRAVRAVKVCAPYDLPSEHYEIWNNVTLRFRHIAEEPKAAS